MIWDMELLGFKRCRKAIKICGILALGAEHAARSKAPHRTGSEYYNYKGFFPVVLLAVVNGNYRILAVELGGKGRESDAELPQKTPRTFFLESSVKNFPIGGDLGGEGPVNYHILSDGGFAQKTWMQRPFRQPECANDPLKLHFNERFSPLVLHNLLVDRMPRQELLQRFPPIPQEVTHEAGSRAPASSEAQAQRLRMVEYFARRDGLNQADHPDRPGSVRRDVRWHVPEASPDNRIARFVNLIDRVVGKMTLEHAVSKISKIDAVSALKISSTGWIIAASGLNKTAVSGGMEVPRVSVNCITCKDVSDVDVIYPAEIHGDIKVGDDYGTTRVSGQNSGPMYGYKITRIPEWQSLMRTTSTLGPFQGNDQYWEGIDPEFRDFDPIECDDFRKASQKDNNSTMRTTEEAEAWRNNEVEPTEEELLRTPEDEEMDDENVEHLRRKVEHLGKECYDQAARKAQCGGEFSVDTNTTIDLDSVDHEVLREFAERKLRARSRNRTIVGHRGQKKTISAYVGRGLDDVVILGTNALEAFNMMLQQEQCSGAIHFYSQHMLKLVSGCVIQQMVSWVSTRKNACHAL
ncbi:unnamed protein product [Nippostrongylus brasiliensis]|uniref:DDE Tnp4 domain-containing protein n=1 Tax=Nippostrongylus brasiliensis TaxID=27835 RepID=A0A158R3K2_NIPBR|nr:unnamed protein product [Nippostrongylus brasiliensis]